MTDKKVIGICSDHAGYELKLHVIGLLHEMGYETEDFGCPSAERCDYPDYAHPMAQAIQDGKLERGISICGSG
ncbi:MAG: RpiB/LacA/LacB family sugar-phosphate isomerase, partial [Porphyromonadaceae bacterium]|nr:RpiB/LacA/LacB family sugar-phosphate isomerase [Porphyromonadaceae bacterium]